MTNKSAGANVAFLISIVVLWCAAIAGWVSNLYWLLAVNSETTTEFWVALVGAVVAPLGALHGIYTWF